MASRAHHARLITMTPLSAAVFIVPSLRAGEKHGLDFEVPLRPGLLPPHVARFAETPPWPTPDDEMLTVFCVDGALAALLQRAALDGAKQPTQLLPAPRRARHRRRAAEGRGLRTRHGRVAGVPRACLEPPGRAGSLARPHGGREAGSRRGGRARRRRAA